MTEHNTFEQRAEKAALQNLQRQVETIVNLMTSKRDEIVRIAVRGVPAAAQDQRDLDFQTFPYVASNIIHELQTMIFNLPLDRLIQTAADAEQARSDRKAAGQ